MKRVLPGWPRCVFCPRPAVVLFQRTICGEPAVAISCFVCWLFLKRDEHGLEREMRFFEVVA